MVKYRVEFKAISRGSLYKVTNEINALSEKQAKYLTCESFKKCMETTSLKVVSKIELTESEADEGSKVTKIDNHENLSITEIESSEDIKVIGHYATTIYVYKDNYKYRVRDKVSAYSEKQARLKAYARAKRYLGIEKIVFFKPTEVKCVKKYAGSHIIDLSLSKLDAEVI